MLPTNCIACGGIMSKEDLLALRPSDDVGLCLECTKLYSTPGEISGSEVYDGEEGTELC